MTAPPKNKGHFKPGHQLSRKFTPEVLRETHGELVAHLKAGGGWDDFPAMDRKTINVYRNAPKHAANFPPGPIMEAHREGARLYRIMLQEQARGYRIEKDPTTGRTKRVQVKGDVRAALALWRNKGGGENPAAANPDYDQDEAANDAAPAAPVAIEITLVDRRAAPPSPEPPP